MFISDVMAVLLTDLIFFVTEANQKLNFYSQDNKVGVYYILFHHLFI